MGYALALLAGVLVAFSPCILPVLPIVVGSALQKDRSGPVFLALGIVTAFTTVGVFVSLIGFSIGLRPETIRYGAAALMMIFGTVLVLPKIQFVLENAFRPLAGAANKKMSGESYNGKFGQFFLGVLLGAVWSPCVGPVLGAALGMASQRETVFQAGVTMFLFALGTTLPLLLIAYASRSFFAVNQEKLLKFGEISKRVLGAILLVTGSAVLLGLDKLIETKLLDLLPEAWIDLVTKF